MTGRRARRRKSCDSQYILLQHTALLLASASSPEMAEERGHRLIGRCFARPRCVPTGARATTYGPVAAPRSMPRLTGSR